MKSTCTRTLALGSNLHECVRASGELGRGVNIDEKQLSDVEREDWKRGWNDFQFNEFVSNKISVHRNLPDLRSRA